MRNLFEFSIDECLAELPKVIAKDPTDLTPNVFPNLSSGQQKVFLSILMSANASKDAFLFARLDRGTIHDIFSFVPLHDENRLAALRQLYQSLEYEKDPDRWEPGTLCLKALHDSSLRHFSFVLLLDRMIALTVETIDDT
jgi:hypothetical protein